MDILVSACSSVVLTPSLAAMVANRFGLRPDAATYALGGHGCTGGVLAIDLARRLMQARARACAPPPAAHAMVFWTSGAHVGIDVSVDA